MRENLRIKPSCVYCILNIITNERYVGSTTNFSDRKGSHLYDMRHNKHQNNKLQGAFDKYGEQNLKFFILEEVETFDRDFLEKREQFWMDKYTPEYNLNPVAGNFFNTKAYSEESKQKRIAKITGRKQSQEEKDKRAKSIREHWAKPENRGTKKVSKEQRELLSKINMGKRNPNFGLHRSEDTKRKSSESNSKIIYTFRNLGGVVSFGGLKRGAEEVLKIPYWAARKLYQGKIGNFSGWEFVGAEKIAPSP